MKAVFKVWQIRHRYIILENIQVLSPTLIYFPFSLYDTCSTNNLVGVINSAEKWFVYQSILGLISS